jgi:uncharacterized protein YndB with AHSA1/START domain
MSDSTTAASHDAVTAEIDIAAAPERVFRALTDPARIFAWWSKEPSVELSVVEMDARPGGRWRLHWKPVEGLEQGESWAQLRRNGAHVYEAHGRIVEYDPPRLLAWTWVANWHEDPQHPTLVRWELTPTERGTHVRVTHSGLAAEAIGRKDYPGGWVGVLNLLRGFLQLPTD